MFYGTFSTNKLYHVIEVGNVSHITCSAALPDTGKQHIDTDIVTAGHFSPL